MSAQTSIEWTERTWNPVTGCDRVSAGCDHCYAATMARRLQAMGNPRYRLDGDPRKSGPGFGLTLHWDLIDLPRTWVRPRSVFVNSMSDLFHDRVPFEFIAAVFATMAATPQHTYQVLTKRSARLLRLAPRLPWPANVWMGVSVENQANLIRAARLIKVPAAVRFISVEPMLGQVDLRPVLTRFVDSGIEYGHGLTLTRGGHDEREIDWVIAGGESGPGARPCDLAWLRDLRDQCWEWRRVAFFLKQLGGYPDKRGGELAVLDGRMWHEMPGRYPVADRQRSS
jgi:protein gp37